MLLEFAATLEPNALKIADKFACYGVVVTIGEGELEISESMFFMLSWVSTVDSVQYGMTYRNCECSGLTVANRQYLRYSFLALCQDLYRSYRAHRGRRGDHHADVPTQGKGVLQAFRKPLFMAVLYNISLKALRR